MRIRSTIFFAVAAVSISETINNATRAIVGDRVWLTSSLAVGAIDDVRTAEGGDTCTCCTPAPDAGAGECR